MADQIPGGAEGPNNWQVIGISRDQWRLLGAALRWAATCAPGLEDNFYLPNGEMARSNGDLIAKARQMAEDVGRRAGDGRRGPGAAGRAEAEVPAPGARASDRGIRGRPMSAPPWATFACST